MRRGDKEFLTDILESIKRIKSYSNNVSYSQFLKDIKTQDSIVRNLEIIGEAAKRISDELKKNNSSVEWKNISDLRNRLIHDYFGTNLDIVWGIIEEDLDTLKKEISKIIKSF